MQEEIRQLLCILTNDNPTATNDLCILIMERINVSLDGHIMSTDLGSNIRHEISLLASLLQIKDDCWDVRLRCMVELFLKACEDTRSPLVMESIILPCLKIWYSIIKPPTDTNSKQAKDKSNNSVTALKNDHEKVPVDLNKWIQEDPKQAFISWRTKLPVKSEDSPKVPTSSSEVTLIQSRKMCN